MRLGRAGMVLGAVATAGLACADSSLTPDLPGPAARFMIVEGDAQRGTVGSLAGHSLAVHVSDASGRPVAGIPVRWSAGTSGTMVPGLTATNLAGEARTALRFGEKAGLVEVVATAAGLAPLVFHHTAEPAAAARIASVSGSGQNAPVATALAQPVRVRVLDRFGNPVAGAPVVWRATGGGTLDLPQSTSDSAGAASARWTLGTVAGPQRAWARLALLDSIDFTATAQAAALAELRVEPASAVLEVAQQMQFRAAGKDRYGNEVSVGAPVWSADPASLVVLGSNGAVRGLAVGALDIAATLSGRRALARLTVTPSSVSRVSLSPDRALLPVGDSVVVVATAFSAGGAALAGRWTDWSASGTALALQQAPGSPTVVVRAAGAGTERVTATVAGRAAYIDVEARQPGNARFTTLAAGTVWNCAITPEGAGSCWGASDSTLITGAEPTGATSPEPIPGTTRFATLALGSFHACGLDAAGSAFCWGKGSAGRLGNGDTKNSAVPVPVAGGRAFTALTLGHDHSCALTQTGAAYCWGENDAGQLGTGDALPRSVPVPVVGGPFVQLAAGYRYTCGIKADGVAQCWGFNDYGQLGTGDTKRRLLPTAVVTGVRFTRLAAGAAHACALTASGQVHCWGNNYFGQLGDGTRSDRLLPVRVDFATPLTALVSRGGHTCGLAAGGAAFCWGWGEAGQLGTGDRRIAERPVAVTGPVRFSSLAVGALHSCGLASDGQAFCWGDNTYGQVGDLSRAERTSPVPVKTFR
jgi:alpha-tubulin suppressor-like RCC1 family protein